MTVCTQGLKYWTLKKRAKEGLIDPTSVSAVSYNAMTEAPKGFMFERWRDLRNNARKKMNDKSASRSA